MRPVDADALIRAIKASDVPLIANNHFLEKLIQRQPTLALTTQEKHNDYMLKKIVDLARYNRLIKLASSSDIFSAAQIEYSKNYINIFIKHNIDYETYLSISEDLADLSKSMPPDPFLHE